MIMAALWIAPQHVVAKGHPEFIPGFLGYPHIPLPRKSENKPRTSPGNHKQQLRIAIIVAAPWKGVVIVLLQQLHMIWRSWQLCREAQLRTKQLELLRCSLNQ